MRLLLDTHAVIWFLAGDLKLSARARAGILDDDSIVVVSAASAMEITTKHRLGRLPEAAEIAVDFEASMFEFGFGVLSISVQHAQLAGSMRIDHQDPFDRLLIAQALIENLVLVSNERLFDSTGVNRLW